MRVAHARLVRDFLRGIRMGSPTEHRNHAFFDGVERYRFAAQRARGSDERDLKQRQRRRNAEFQRVFDKLREPDKNGFRKDVREHQREPGR